ncbi:MAG: diguanylate cyclase domain-containing protein, partial [Gammaproteobacteria bacterium]
MKILVSDDSPTTLAILTASLKKLEHEVIATSSAEQAILAYQKEKPDLIILDVVMQPMDGFECAKKIRDIENTEWIPIIFLSASVDDESIAKGIDAGGDDYLTKPFSEVTLAAKIKAMQRIHEMRNQLYEATCKLGRLSTTDTLTGLYNRLQFNNTLPEKIAFSKRHNTLFALLFLDLDNFKFVNDHFGHPVGDQLLQEIAIRLRACVREYDFIARLGGDEFAIIINDIKSIEDAGNVAQNILDAIDRQYTLSHHTFNIGCSIGIACYPSAGIDHETLTRNADSAMYHAKELGRNNYQYFTDELFAKQNIQVQLRDALPYALEMHELLLLYDPIYELQTKSIIGMEALPRWKHPHLGEVLPEQFFPLAEELGLNVSITTWALQNLCQQGGKWYAQGHQQFKLSFAISYRYLLRKDFPTLIKSILDESKLPANMLELELQSKETITMIYPGFMEQAINELAHIGVGIVIDDFGIGYSSLINLQKLPITCLKINKSFVEDITTNTHAAMIVRSSSALGKSL